MKHHFLIISNYRCGATWLQVMLNRLSDVSCEKEFVWPTPETCKSHQEAIGTIAEQLTADSPIVGGKLVIFPHTHKVEEYLALSQSVDNVPTIIHLYRDYTEMISSIILNRGYSPAKKVNTSQSRLLKGIKETARDLNLGHRRMTYGELVTLIKGLNSNESWMMSTQSQAKKCLNVGYHEIISRFTEIVRFIGSSTPYPDIHHILHNPDITKLPHEPKPCVLQYKKSRSLIASYETQRTIQRNLSYLSSTAKSHLEYACPLQRYSLEDSAQFDASHSPAICYDTFLSTSQILSLLRKHPIGVPSNLVIIFLHTKHIMHILSESAITPYLINGRLKLWHSAEWETKLQTAGKNLHSSILYTQSVYAPTQEMRQRIKKMLAEMRCTNTVTIETQNRATKRYYSSNTYKKRLTRIAQGMPPKIFVERQCKATATSHFSDNCTATLEKLGYSVTSHRCSEDHIDTLETSYAHISSIQPDFVIRSPNIWFPLPVPSYYSFYEESALYSFHKHLIHNAINEMDIVSFPWIQHIGDFPERYRTRGQVFQSYLPADTPSFNPDDTDVKQHYDIGFVKAISGYHTLTDIVHSSANTTPTSIEKQGKIRLTEKMILNRIKHNESIDREECASMLQPFSSSQWPVTYFRQRQALHIISFLQKARFSLSLIGANWDKFPHLKPYAIGYLNDRTEYLFSFLTTKINISFDPWEEYHPRIFEGGRCGAFFLVSHIDHSFAKTKLSDILTPGEHFVYFYSPEDLLEKCHYYLQHQQERTTIGNNLKTFLAEQYTYDAFCQHIIDTFQQLLLNPQLATVS